MLIVQGMTLSLCHSHREQQSKLSIFIVSQVIELNEVTAVSLTPSENFDIGMHELIWLKLGMLVATIELSIFILVFLTLTLIQDYR